MTQEYNSFNGNFREIASLTGLLALMPNMVDEELYSKTMTDIFKDLARSYFVETNDKTFDDFLNAWTQSDLFKSYTQGNITAEVFSLLFQSFIFSSQHFINSEKNRTGTQDCRNLYIHTSKTLTFSYFDDENILCGFCLTYSTEDPSLWFAAKIRHTTLSPEQRQVTIVCHNDILDCSQDALIAKEDAHTKVSDMLGCKSLQKQFENIILADGCINNESFDHVLKEIIENKKKHNEINRTKVKQKENQYKAMYDSFVSNNSEYTEIKENPLKAQAQDTHTKYCEKKEAINRKVMLSEDIFKEQSELTQAKAPQVLEPSFLKRNKISFILGVSVLVLGLSLVIGGSLLLMPYAASLILFGVSMILLALVVSPLKILIDEKPVVAYSKLIKQHDEEKSKLHAELNQLNNEYEKTKTLEQTNKLKELEAPFEKSCRKSLSEPLKATHPQLFFTDNQVVMLEGNEAQCNDNLKVSI